MRLIAASFLLSTAVFAAPFTIEQVLSAPFPSSLTTNHGKIAWVQNARGVRNVWVAEGPDYNGRQLTAYTEDDGQEIDELAISGDGAAVAYTRGDGPNGKGEFPNPRHAVAGIEQAVFIVPFAQTSAGAAPREIGKGHISAISPDSKTIAFVSGGQLWSAPLEGSAKAAQLIHARGSIETVEWSPDGQYIAVTSQRDFHSFIGVYSVAAKTLRFLDPSTDQDSSPVWSPDGTRIAFVRMPAEMDDLVFGPKRTAPEPWSIRVASVADAFEHEVSHGREIWKAPAGAGSEFREITGNSEIFWGANDRIVFPWERTGWTHLYSVTADSVPAGGGEPIELTPGPFEVEEVSLSLDRRSAIFNSNQGDIDRRHLWRVPVAGGAPQPITKGGGIEWSPVEVAASGEVACLRSDPRITGRAAVVNAAGAHDLAPQSIPADFPAASLVEPQRVVFPSADGLELHGQLFLPHDGKAKHAALVFFHGGSRRQMLLGWHYMYYYSQAYGFNQYLASKGYIVLSVNYRSGIGYGLNFREALNYGATGASEFNDVLGAGLYLRTRSDVIPTAIGLWGGSYGGYLTALGLARASDLFAAGVDMHGVHEWNQEISNFVPSYEPQKRADVARIAFESSPLASVSTWKSPVLLVHGDDDRNVNFRQTIMLVDALRQQHVDFEELIFPDEIHDFLLEEHWLAAYHAAESFFAKHLPAGTAQ
jgi:dipeptidyl aminopeptidase/acylaminoacyl peptidase